MQLRASFPAIQVGFGFALTSVGGLLALNRRIDVDAMRSRLAAGTALTDLAATFPVRPGSPWSGRRSSWSGPGSSPSTSAIFIELPGPRRVVLLGSARVRGGEPVRGQPVPADPVGRPRRARPAEADRRVRRGAGRQHLLEVLELTGGAAFRLSYGADPYVVLTVGGFHPAYSPTPLVFPSSLTRIAMTRGTPTDILYFRFEGYFAVTTNTVQFGASVEVIINLGSFNIRGALAFDTLIERSPFHFTCVLHASVQVRWKGRNLGGLDLTGELSGPGPVIFRGKVSFDILFCTISFNHTFRLGSAVPAALTPVDSVLTYLLAELDEPDNLRAAGAADASVILAAPPTSGPPVVAPVGQLVWSQRRAPLDLLLDKLGRRARRSPGDDHRSRGDQVTASGDRLVRARRLHRRSVTRTRLARPAFERLSAGVRIGLTGTDDGPTRTLTVTVKQIRVPAPPAVVGGGSFPRGSSPRGRCAPAPPSLR